MEQRFENTVAELWAKLQEIVDLDSPEDRESQVNILVNESKFADLFKDMD